MSLFWVLSASLSSGCTTSPPQRVNCLAPIENMRKLFPKNTTQHCQFGNRTGASNLLITDLTLYQLSYCRRCDNGRCAVLRVASAFLIGIGLSGPKTPEQKAQGDEYKCNSFKSSFQSVVSQKFNFTWVQFPIRSNQNVFKLIFTTAAFTLSTNRTM